MKRFAFWFAIALLVVVLIVPLSLYLVVRSDAGSRVILNWALPFSPIEVNFVDVQGNLLEGMTFSDFAMASDTFQLQADSLDIAWQPQMLWVGSLSLQQIEFQNLDVRTSTAEQNNSDEAGWPEVSTPIEISIDSFVVDGFILNDAELLQRLEFSGDMSGSELNVERLLLQRPTEQLSLSGQLSLNGLYAMALQFDWQYEFEGQNWTGSAGLAGDFENLELAHRLMSPYQIQSEIEFQQQLPDSPAELALDRISFTASHQSEQLDLRDRLGEPGLISDLVVETSGTMDLIEVDFEAQLELPWAGVTQVSGAGNYESGVVTLQRLLVESQRGQVAASGSYDLDAQFVSVDEIRLVDLQVAEGFNPIQAELGLQGDFSDGADIQATLREASLEQGSLNLVADGDFRYQDNQFQASELNLASGENQLVISGQLYPTPDFTWQLRGAELGTVVQELAGLDSAQIALEGSGSLAGDYGDPIIEADLQGREIAVIGVSMETLQLQIDRVENQHRLEVNIPTLDYRGRSLNNIELGATYAEQTVDVQTSLALESMGIVASATGSKQAYWNFELTQLDLTAPQPIGNWSMQQALAVEQSTSGWSASSACWVSAADAGLCIDGDVSGGTLDLELTDLPLGFLDYLLVSPLRLDGLLNGSLHVEGIGENLSMQAELTSDSGSLLVLGQDRTPDPVAYRQLSVAANMQDQLVSLDAGVQLGESSSAQAQGQINLTSEQPEIDAELTLDMNSLQWVDGVVPQIDSVRGGLSLRLGLLGVLNNPSVSASGELWDGGFIIPRAGIELSDMQINAQAQGDNRIQINASATSGQGQIMVDGVIDAEELDELAAQFSVGGENFQLLDRPDMFLSINPDLQIDFSPTLLDIGGDLNIQEARVRVRELPEGGVRPSDDEVIVGESGATDRQLQTSLDINISLGSQVEFEGFGLTTGLTGELDIEQSAGEPQRSFGTIELVDGEYSAYGRTLNVQRGRMIFQGEFDNPALDVDAEQTYTDYTVGIHLGGTVQQPTTTLYSNPAMSQSDVLAILITGQRLDTMSASEAPSLLDAVTRLGIVGGSSIAERIEDSFGLSEFGVRNDNQNGQSFVAGTYVLPRLYVEWAQGLFEASSAVQLEYRISDQLRLKARSGTSQSMDLIYEIETD